VVRAGAKRDTKRAWVGWYASEAQGPWPFAAAAAAIASARLSRAGPSGDEGKINEDEVKGITCVEGVLSE